jgi:hypothetical protein
MADEKDKKVQKKDQVSTQQAGTPLTREYLSGLSFGELQSLAAQNSVDPSLPQGDLINALEGIIVYGIN